MWQDGKDLKMVMLKFKRIDLGYDLQMYVG
jgi:hypothetical protein